MKTIYKRIYVLLLFSIAITFLWSACEDESKDMVKPVISEVRNYAASPDDTVIQTVEAGQWIVLVGENLKGVSHVLFGSTPATLNSTFQTDQHIVVEVPAIPFQSIPRNKLNEITLVTEGGLVTFTINIVGAPIVSRVRNYDAAPNDTIVKAIVPGQKINIVGYNLKDATQISFQGINADLTDVVYTDSSAIIQVPVDLSGGDASQVNMINYTTDLGSGTFAIRIIGPPIVTGVSNEVPNEGDSVRLYGNNLSLIENLTFSGVTISSFRESSDGSSVGFVAPALTTSGPVEVTTKSGTFSSAYNVNDITTGAISNFEWNGVFHWDWWGGANLTSGDPASGWPPYSADFPGNKSLYLVLKTNVLNGGAGDEWSTAVRIGGVQWLPAENLSDPVNAWALKFEINIPNSWKGGTIAIKSSSGNYIARYEPWQISSVATAPYSTDGWHTVVIPLSSFRAKDDTLGDGKGAPITSITDLLGDTGKSDLILYMHNYSASPTETGFNAAFDNFRVVKQ